MKTSLLKAGIIVSIVASVLFMALSILMIVIADQLFDNANSFNASVSQQYYQSINTENVTDSARDVFMGIFGGLAALHFLLIVMGGFSLHNVNNAVKGRSEFSSALGYTLGVLALLFSGIIPGLLILIGAGQAKDSERNMTRDDRGPRRDYDDRGPRRDYDDRRPRRDYDDRRPRRDYDDRRPSRVEYYDEEPRSRRSDRWEK